MLPLRAGARLLAALASLTVAAALAAAPPARAEGGGAGVDYVPGQVIVKVRGHAPKVAHVGSVAHAVASLRRRADVAYAAPNVIAHATGVVRDGGWFPDDPGRGGFEGWEKVQWNMLLVDAPHAWENLREDGRPGGEGVTVAVVDSGVAYRNHGRHRRSPDFLRHQFVRGRDFCSHDSHRRDRACRGRDHHPDDVYGHGTHVAGTIAEETDNGIGVTGLAYGVRIMPVKVLNHHGEGDAHRIALGIRWAARHGADVINLSLEFSTGVGARDIPEILDAIRYAQHRGALVVGAAGNESLGRVAMPARDHRVLAVGAVTADACEAEYSNSGRRLDIVAPGGGRDADLRGDDRCRPFGSRGPDVYQMTFRGHSIRRFGLPSGYRGTSMAVPHVSAAAALVIASGVLGPHPAPEAVAERLEATATDLGRPGRDRHYGWGLLDAGAATDPGAPHRRPESDLPPVPAT